LSKTAFAIAAASVVGVICINNIDIFRRKLILKLLIFLLQLFNLGVFSAVAIHRLNVFLNCLNPINLFLLGEVAIV